MCLDGLEQKLAEQFGQKNTAPARRHKVNYVRFADDFICTGSSRELLSRSLLSGCVDVCCRLLSPLEEARQGYVLIDGKLHTDDPPGPIAVAR